MFVKGSVKDNTGKPVSGVVVTDGAHFKTTDAQGNYVLNTDPARYPMVLFFVLVLILLSLVRFLTHH